MRSETIKNITSLKKSDMATGTTGNLWVDFNSIFLLLAIGSLVTSAITEVSNGNDVCADGIYQHDGRNCCLCARGQKVLEHCKESPNDRKCEFCEEGKTYREEPTSEATCEPCDSCSHPNANLEVVDHCTSSRNAKCGCTKGYYCSSKEESCVICHPCDTCESTGIKIACNGTSNTLCNESEGLSDGAIAGIVVCIIFVLGVGGLIYWRKKKARPSDEAESEVSEELVWLNEVDIEPHLPDIAQTLGWKDMVYIARKSQVSETTIDSCRLNHPNNTEESTYELLKIWLELKGTSGLRSLVQMLQTSGKRQKKEKILQLIRNSNNERNNQVTNSNPV